MKKKKILLIIFVLVIISILIFLIYQFCIKTNRSYPLSYYQKEYNFPLDSEDEAISYSLTLGEVNQIINQPLPSQCISYSNQNWWPIVRKWYKNPGMENEWVIEWHKGLSECQGCLFYLRFNRGGQVTLSATSLEPAYCK